MLISLNLDRLSKKCVRAELLRDMGLARLVLSLKVKGKERPGTIKAHVGRKLFPVFVGRNGRSVHTDDISYALTNGQVFKFVGEEND